MKMPWSQWCRCNIGKSFLFELKGSPIVFSMCSLLLGPLERWSAAEGVLGSAFLFPHAGSLFPRLSNCLPLVPFANIHNETGMPRDPCHFLMRFLWCTVVEKKNEQVPLSLRTAGCHCYPAKMQVSGKPEGFSAVDLLSRFQEQTTVGPDSAEESCWKRHLSLRPFHLCGRFPFKDKKLGGRIYCIEWQSAVYRYF